MNSHPGISPSVKSSPLYQFGTGQPFAGEEIKFKPIVELLELLFGNMAFGNFFIKVVDFRTYTYPYASPNVASVIGYSQGQVTGFDWFESVVHPDDLGPFTEWGTRAFSYVKALPMDQKKRAMVNICFRIKHGIRDEYVWVYQQCHMSYIDANGALVYVIALLTDVTDLAKDMQGVTWSVIERKENGDTQFHIGSEPPRPKLKSEKPSLTLREREVLRLSAKGLSTRGMVSQLGISYETILTHKKKVLVKTGAKNMSEAMTYALKMGYL